MIKIDNVSFSYKKGKKILEDISIEIPKGKWVSVIGHNGSGKSTLSKLLVGILPAYGSQNQEFEGEISIDGITICPENEDKFIKKVGIVFQNPDNQFVGGTVEQDIAFGLENNCVEKKEMRMLIDKFAKQVGMIDYLDVEPHDLSGGQKQRVAIAGLLAMDRDYMIFDEATSMLDPVGKQEVVNFIKLLSQEMEKTIITITHDLDIAALSDHVIFLNKGKVQKEGKPEDVFEDAKELEDAGLDLPYPLKIKNEIEQNNILKNDEALGDYLWELFSMM